MKKLLLPVLLLLFLAPGSAPAQDCQIPSGMRLVPMGYEEITVAATAIGFTTATIQPGTDSNQWARVAFASVETAEIRWRVSGTPTATSGHLVAAAGSFSVCGVDSLAAIRMIRTTATSAKVSVSYYRLQ
jgi:hypothetical protein